MPDSAAPSIARAFWSVAPGRGEIRDQPLPAPADDQVRVRSLFGAVSRGTESLVFAGRVPVSQYGAMRAPHQGGDFPFPVKYGYSLVGIVEAGPAALRGRTVFCLHPHQTACVLAADAVVPVPDGVPPSRAVLAANMETALNGLWDAAVLPGDRVAVVGAGVVGCLAARLIARMPGCAVELVDTDPAKASVAARLGASFAAPTEARTDNDLVIEVSGAPDGLAVALGLAAFEATVLELSWFGDHPVTAPLGEAFHARRLTIRGSQVGAVATRQRARWPHRRRLALALELLADDALDTLFSGESAFDDLPDAMPALATGGAGILCHRIRYPAP
ncbi:MAG: zinc-dependent alcohol dehydrogenase [Inquilinaceae bacterium]